MMPFHKIDKDNLDSKSDIKFLKQVAAIEENEEYGVYLFGLKTSLNCLKILVKNKKLLQSIISLHRCMFCLSKIMKKQNDLKSKLDKTKVQKDAKPICHRCVEHELYTPKGEYLTSDVLSNNIKLMLSKMMESSVKTKPIYKERSSNLWLDVG